jgi:cobyrinic acid a,c-diamide synthase
VNLDRVLAIADSAPAFTWEKAVSRQTVHEPLRIAIARDQAFGFYYSEDLDTLRASGAELINVDTIRDAALPAADGLIIGGGFPEVFMDALEANSALRHNIQAHIERGLPTYAECGGLMYLAKSIHWKGQTRQMVGSVPGEVVMHDRPVGRGYARLQPRSQNVWDESAEIPAHEFHYSSLENMPHDADYAYKVTRGHGIDGVHDGYVHHNLLAGYVHRRGSGQHGWIPPFLNQVRAHKDALSQPHRSNQA